MRNDLKLFPKTNNDLGFSLIEIIAVLVILSILASVSVPRFVDLSSNAAQKGLDVAMDELNGQEILIWAKIKNSEAGWIDYESLFLQIDTSLGSYYRWSPHAQITGGILHFKDQMVKLNRIPSTSLSPGMWVITFSS
jgi:prepilin-type N-terminal cleavage/methylation domain-containing protein